MIRISFENKSLIFAIKIFRKLLITNTQNLSTFKHNIYNNKNKYSNLNNYKFIAKLINHIH